MPWLTVNQTRLLRRSAVPTADFALDVHRGAMPGAPGGRPWDSLIRPPGHDDGVDGIAAWSWTSPPACDGDDAGVQAQTVDYDCAGSGWRWRNGSPGVMTGGSTSGDSAPEVPSRSAWALSPAHDRARQLLQPGAFEDLQGGVGVSPANRRRRRLAIRRVE